jgi:hypothetical protein
MKQLVWHTLITISILILIIVGLVAWSFNTCALSLSLADDVVRKHLAIVELDPQFLSAGTFDEESCAVRYTYLGGGRDIHYTIIDDPMRGAKTTWYEYTRENSNQ